MAGKQINRIRKNTANLMPELDGKQAEEQMVKAKVEQEPIKAPQPTPTQPTMVISNTTPEPPQKGKEAPVSIWLDKDTKRRLKATSTATQQSVSKLVNIAINEYLTAHKLTADQRIIYDAVMRMSDK